MARSDWILPRAESACGKVFLPDRKAAEEHRIALQFWIAATKHAADGPRSGYLSMRSMRWLPCRTQESQTRQGSSESGFLAGTSNTNEIKGGESPCGGLSSPDPRRT